MRVRSSLPFAALLPLMMSCGDGPTDRKEPYTRSSTRPLWSAAPDASGFGPLAIAEGEYRLPVNEDPDPDVLMDRKTELWARVYRPKFMTGVYPLIMMLPGNHGTCGTDSTPRLDHNCDYTVKGTCPPAYPVRTPSHLGYGYLARRLASWGYVTVSINANLGINCADDGPLGDKHLNLARGRLILKHLQKLSEWNAEVEKTYPTLGVDLAGKLDFTSVGLLGHSRGGEGVRAAYAQYRAPKEKWPGLSGPIPWPDRIPDIINFSGIFEIGAIDGQTSKELNAEGTPWNQLLPACDGDVDDLQGAKPFERMIRSSTTATAPASYTLVWGANHNFYNTEWQQSDSARCGQKYWPQKPIFNPIGSASAQQQKNLLQLATAFFRGNVWSDVPGAFNWEFTTTFDPIWELPPHISSVTQVDRAYYEPKQLVLDDMAKPPPHRVAKTGDVTYSYEELPEYPKAKEPKDKRHIAVVAITWGASLMSTDPPPTFQTTWPAKDLSDDLSIDFRIARQASLLNAASGDPTDFKIQLLHGDGSMSSSVSLSHYTGLNGPPTAPSKTLEPMSPTDLIHRILRTVRLPISDFTDAKLKSVRGLRFTFDSTPQGAIYLANIRRTMLSTPSSISTPMMLAVTSPSSGPASAGVPSIRPFVSQPSEGERLHYSHHAIQPQTVITSGNVVISLKTIRSADPDLNGGLEVELASNTPFLPRNELFLLRIGELDIDWGGGNPLNLNRALFRLTSAERALLRGGEPMSVQYGRGHAAWYWDFGRLDLGMIERR